IPGVGLISLINGFVDRAIGADGLAPPVRSKLLRQQLGSVSRMTPAMLAASLVVSVVFLGLCWQTPGLWPVLVALTIINLIALHGIYVAFGRRPARAERASHRSVTSTVTHALLMGLLWGFVLNVLPVYEDLTLRGAVAIGAGGLLCISMMA